ncbi:MULTISPECIES: aspartate kinase [Oceanobacillus]|uniref:Aspartokinase n=1 Tax=Oceanobacillus indicireducens TaxID=1004261 RepID=A0A917XWW3_9BACI|nr:MULTISPECIES: aspartate kinase [Oceanobacillus]GGN56750.1 aspartokinase [Oceanobacillus indicireducens]
MKVAKFGGSSMASASQLIKVGDIIKDDASRKFIVVSAPGKRFKEDTKMTDLLIDLGTAYLQQTNFAEQFEAIMQRFTEIVTELELPDTLLDEFTESLKRVQELSDNEASLMDAVKAIGEDSSAKMLSAYLNKIGINSSYINPQEAGLILSDEPGNAQILPDSFDKIRMLRERDGVLVIPGFFGYTEEGKLVTFSRGGSDITGSLIAAGVEAEIYENFTDVDSVFTVNPSFVSNPKTITKLTYKEMRELSYAGFSVFHDEALIPAYHAKIPVAIKNTNNPLAKGTLIVAERELNGRVVTGIASDTGFCSLYVSKYLMNREIGFGRKLLNIFEDEGVSFEHAPSGIDNMSVIFRERNLPRDKERIILERIKNELHPDTVSITRGIAIIMVVGEGLVNSIGVANRATEAFTKANVNIEMINQGSSEVSMMFGIQAADLKRAIRSLYELYFMEEDALVRSGS